MHSHISNKRHPPLISSIGQTLHDDDDDDDDEEEPNK
jgi:hypothetical protein